MKNLKLVSKFNILIDLVEFYGPSFLLKQRSSKIYLSSPLEMSQQQPEMKNALYHVYKEMKLLEIISEPIGIRQLQRPYALRRPEKFKDYILSDLIKRMGDPHSYTLPRHLRDQPSETILQKISHSLSQAQENADSGPLALALLHSAFLFDTPIYSKSKIFRGRSPICLMLKKAAKDTLELDIGLKRIGLMRSKPEDQGAFLSLPVNQDQTDLILFEKDGLEEFCRRFSASKGNSASVHPIHHAINLLLLPFHPVRGLEASERLAEIIHAEKSVKKVAT